MAKHRKSNGNPACLRILHLSDFHFRLDKKWDQDPVLNGLAESIEEFAGDGLEPNVVAITGDIAYSGKEKEYDEASKWIDDKLLPTLPTGFDVSKILVVPGNHDVDRGAVKRSVQALQRDLLEEWSQDTIAQTLGDSDERGLLLKRHTAYLEFAKRFGPEDKKSDVPWWSTCLPVGDKNVHFIGLCSSWMSWGNEDHGHLLVGKWQLNEVAAKPSQSDLNVVLVHHPWAYLPDFDRHDVETHVHRESHLVLRGHLHQQRSRSSTDPDNACVELAAGSVYDGSKYPNAYQLIELMPDEMLARVHYRLWRNGEWIVDRNAYKKAPEGVAKFPLQAPADNTPKSRRAAKAAQPDVPGEYRKWLLEQCADIELLGLKVKQGQAVHLNHIYVPLTTSSPGIEHVVGADDPMVLVSEEEAKPTLLLDRLDESSLYVPGAPGAGKSTFCRWVAFLVANGTMPQLEVTPPEGYKEDFPVALQDRFPLLVRLRDFWECLPMSPGRREMASAELEEALCNWIDKKQLPGITGADLASQLAHGSALLILDGVDEVPLSDGNEQNLCSPREMLLTGLMDALPRWHDHGNRLLLTSRPYGLSEDSQRRLALSSAPISTLTPELQRLLVHRWFHTLMDNAAAAKSTADDMLKHIAERTGMGELTNNPMLLTAICIIYGEGKRLPQDTYDLYGRIVDNVLYNRFPMDPVVIEKVRNRLAVIAFGMHSGEALSEKRTTPQALASYDELDCMLRTFQQQSPETEPGLQHTLTTREQLLSQTGLLLPQGDKQAGFYHLSLQEFLAAQRILNLGNSADQLIDVYRERAVVAEWHKTLSFLFACLVSKFTAQHGIQLLTQLVNDIQPESLDNGVMNKAVVAADCVEILRGRGISLQKPLRERLRRICLSAIEEDAPLESLWTVGACLGFMGDPRICDNLRTAETEEAFVPVPMVESGEKPDAISVDEASFISRYPVTNSQFHVYMEDGGYDDPQWWSAEGAKWLVGGEAGRRKKDPAAVPNAPVSVTYWEAEAFATWANASLPQSAAMNVGGITRGELNMCYAHGRAVVPVAAGQGRTDLHGWWIADQAMYGNWEGDEMPHPSMKMSVELAWFDQGHLSYRLNNIEPGGHSASRGLFIVRSREADS